MSPNADWAFQAAPALQGHDLVIIPSSQTLVFEHSYTFWVSPRAAGLGAAAGGVARMLLNKRGPLHTEESGPAEYQTRRSQRAGHARRLASPQ